jgi:hypothetical protein
MTLAERRLAIGPRSAEPIRPAGALCAFADAASPEKSQPMALRLGLYSPSCGCSTLTTKPRAGRAAVVRAIAI